MRRISSKEYNISKLIKGMADRIMTIHSIEKEWKVAIFSLAIARLITMVITAYSAYTFFFVYIHQVIRDSKASILITNIILILVELLAAIFLDKTYKFFFKGKYFTAAFAFIIVLGFYSLSFISSTTGLAQKQSAKKDLSIEIQKEYIIANEKAVNESQKRLNNLDTIIMSIRSNPIVWSRRKRNLLSMEQQNNILELEQQKSSIREALILQLDKIDSQFQDKILINKASMIKTGGEYYKFMEIIVIAQFLMTGILIYLFHLIHSQHQKEQIIAEELYDIKEIIKRRTHSFIYEGVMEAVGNFEDILGETPLKKEFSANKQVHKTEFKSEHNNELVIAKSQKKFQKQTINTNVDALNNAQKNHKNEGYLSKHKKIVQAILQNIPKNQTFLSNADIKNKILPSIQKANFKSFSLIRKVFLIMQDFRIENYDNNENMLK